MTLLNSADQILSNQAFKVEFTYYEKTYELNETTGYYSETNSDIITAFGSIQPVEREEIHEVMQNVIGGQAIRGAIIIYTQACLTAGKLGNTPSGGSIVQYKGLDWVVVDVESYELNGHVEAIAVRFDGQND